MINKIARSMADALADVRDGSTVMIGGFGTAGIPNELIDGLIAQGALVRVCGSRAMAKGVAEALDAILAPLHLSVAQLKAKERYAEDVF